MLPCSQPAPIGRSGLLSYFAASRGSRYYPLFSGVHRRSGCFSASSPTAVHRGEGKVNDVPMRDLGGSRRILSRRWVGLWVAIVLIFFAWSKPASAQDKDNRKVKFSVQPAYPELAKKNKIQGVTRLQVLIAPDGAIKDIKVLGGNPVLVQASVDAVKKWKYEPAAVESTSVLKFEFKPDQ